MLLEFYEIKVTKWGRNGWSGFLINLWTLVSGVTPAFIPSSRCLSLSWLFSKSVVCSGFLLIDSWHLCVDFSYEILFIFAFITSLCWLSNILLKVCLWLLEPYKLVFLLPPHWTPSLTSLLQTLWGQAEVLRLSSIVHTEGDSRPWGNNDKCFFCQLCLVSRAFLLQISPDISSPFWDSLKYLCHIY